MMNSGCQNHAQTGMSAPLVTFWDEDFKEWILPSSLAEVAANARARAEPRSKSPRGSGAVETTIVGVPPEPEQQPVRAPSSSHHDGNPWGYL